MQTIPKQNRVQNNSMVRVLGRVSFSGGSVCSFDCGPVSTEACVLFWRSPAMTNSTSTTSIHNLPLVSRESPYLSSREVSPAKLPQLHEKALASVILQYFRRRERARYGSFSKSSTSESQLCFVLDILAESGECPSPPAPLGTGRNCFKFTTLSM